MTTRAVHVLLVEDNDIDRECVVRAWKRHHVENPLHHASDGLEALELLRGVAGKDPLPRPHLILLDLNMPRMNGVELLRELRQDPALRSSIVLVLTTSNSDQDRRVAYNLNVAGYLVKSEMGAGFIHLVELLQAYWRIVEFP